MRRSLAGLGLVGCLLPGTVAASPPEYPPPKYSDTDRIRAGMFFTVFGAVSITGGTLSYGFATWGTAHAYGFLGLVPLVCGGGFTTLGALLLHFGQERRWARADWAADRAPLDRSDGPRPGAGLLLAGPLTVAGSATIFTWGLLELSVLDADCLPENSYCIDGDPTTAALLLATSGAGMLLGTTLTIVGAERRTRYMSWRAARGRPIQLRPTGWASPRGVGFGLQGQF